MCFTAISKVPRACRVKSPTFETTDLSCPAAVCAARRAVVQAGVWGCGLHTAFAWPGGAVTPRACAMLRALGWCWPPRSTQRRWSWDTWEVVGLPSSTKGDAGGAAGTRSSKKKYFPSSPQTGGALGLIFPADTLFFFFNQWHFPLISAARSAPPVVCPRSAHEGSAAQQ